METLTLPLTGVSTLAWVLLGLQVAVLVSGIYFGFVRQDGKALRGAAFKRFGYALLALGALGTLAGALLVSLVPPFNTWIWSVIVLIFELALAAFAGYYSQRIYPAQVAALQSAQRSAARRPAPARPTAGIAENGTTAASAPRPVSARRDARRANKRKSKR